MAITAEYHIVGNVPAPPKAKIKRLGQGCWRLTGKSNGDDIVYSVDGKTFYRLDHTCGPITLYNCQLYVHEDMEGQICQVPSEIVPRASRQRESISPNPDDQLKDIPVMIPSDYYDEAM